MMMMGNNTQHQQQQLQQPAQRDRRDQHLHALQQNQQPGKQQTPSHDTKQRAATAPRLSLSRSISYSTALPPPTYSPANAPSTAPLPVPPSAVVPSDDPQHLQQQFV